MAGQFDLSPGLQGQNDVLMARAWTTSARAIHLVSGQAREQPPRATRLVLLRPGRAHSALKSGLQTGTSRVR
jgi:hypothetical protein